ncbi:MAG: hypothetical protein ACI87E_005190, partial [Mariniblastus sp.]
ENSQGEQPASDATEFDSDATDSKSKAVVK